MSKTQRNQMSGLNTHNTIKLDEFIVSMVLHMRQYKCIEKL